jgi:hypothetical protein
MYIYIGIILVVVVVMMGTSVVVHDGYKKLRHFVIGKTHSMNHTEN